MIVLPRVDDFYRELNVLLRRGDHALRNSGCQSEPAIALSSPAGSSLNGPFTLSVHVLTGCVVTPAFPSVYTFQGAMTTSDNRVGHRYNPGEGLIEAATREEFPDTSRR